MVQCNPEHITGLVLAGGQGTRMGHADKGLQRLRGYPMVMHVLVRLAPQVGSILINANRNLDVYESLGYPVASDVVTGFAGPLAGIHAGLLRCTTEFMLCVPCDVPFLPLDLARRLHAGLESGAADLATVHAGDQPHPVFCLMRQRVAAGLAVFIEGGGRKIDAWQATTRAVAVDFADQEAAFANINTIEELRAFEPPETPER